MLLQGRYQAFWQYRRPILATFAVTNRYRLRSQIDVLDPQADALVDTQSGTINEFRHQSWRTDHLSQRRPDLLGRQNHWYPDAALHPLQVSHLSERFPEHFPIEEHHSIKRLRLGRGGDMAFSGKVVQEGLDLRWTHLSGVAFAMEQYELPYPVAISALGAAAEVPAAADDGKLVKQAGILTP